MNEQSPCKSVLEAMIAIQAEVQNPLKLARGNNYTYVELDALLDVLRPVATKHGIAIVQHVDADMLVTELWHVSGDSKAFRMPLKPSGLRGGSEAQQMGAAVTYARKYSLMGLFGIHGDKDEDAQPVKDTKMKAAADLAVAQAERVTPLMPDLAAFAAELAAKQPKTSFDLAFTTDPLWNEYVYETAKEKNMTQEKVREAALKHPETVAKKFYEWKGVPRV